MLSQVELEMIRRRLGVQPDAASRTLALVQSNRSASPPPPLPWSVGPGVHAEGLNQPVGEVLVALYTLAGLIVAGVLVLFLTCCTDDPQDARYRAYLNATPPPRIGLPGSSVEPRREPVRSPFSYGYDNGLPRQLPMMWSAPADGRAHAMEGRPHK